MLSRAGVPAVGVRMRVDEDGEILARTNHVFDGYWEQPEETAKALEGGWFHTGDGGYLDGPYTVIADRKKDVIITGGENVSSIEVEDCLYQHAAVAEAAVIGVPDDKWGETVKALVVLRPGAVATEEELIEFCRARLAHFKAPTLGGAPRRPHPDGHRQAPEVQAAPALLGGPRPAGQLNPRLSTVRRSSTVHRATVTPGAVGRSRGRWRRLGHGPSASRSPMSDWNSPKAADFVNGFSSPSTHGQVEEAHAVVEAESWRSAARRASRRQLGEHGADEALVLVRALGLGLVADHLGDGHGHLLMSFRSIASCCSGGRG